MAGSGVAGSGALLHALVRAPARAIARATAITVFFMSSFFFGLLRMLCDPIRSLCEPSLHVPRDAGRDSMRVAGRATAFERDVAVVEPELPLAGREPVDFTGPARHAAAVDHPARQIH